MSEPQDLTIDLESAFLPAWAQKPATANRYANHPGEAERPRREFGDRSERRGPRPGGSGGPGRGPGGPGGGNRFGGGGGGGRDRRGPGLGGGGAPGPHSASGGIDPGGLKWDPTRGPQGRPQDRRGGGRPWREEAPLPPIDVEFRPDPAGVVSLARQIRLSGRSFPLLDVANLVMQKPDRYEVIFRTLRNKEGGVAQPLFTCALDDTLWLSEADAARYALSSHFDTFYRTEKQPCDPPKGTWTLVAVFEDEVLGPPNYHGYQERLREIHGRRGGRLSLEEFKSRVRVVKDEAAVKQWLESQSHRLQYVTLNTPEPVSLNSRAEVETHFRETHAAVVVKPTEQWKLVRGANLPPLPEPLNRLLRFTLEREQRFPIRMMTALSSEFSQAGLQFFKLNKNEVHVSVARPRYLDIETTSVSTMIRQIIDFINAHPGATRKRLVEALAPGTPAVASAAAEAMPPVTEPVAAPTTDIAGTPEATAAETQPLAAPVIPETPAEPAPVESPAALLERQVLGDLHWLVHQGHVIEFGSGVLEVTRKPVLRPDQHPQAPAKARQAAPENRGPRPRRARFVWDNVGLLPLPSPQPALVG